MIERTVYIHTLGCPKNTSDSENMAYELELKGYSFVYDALLADIIVINTCCFINDAKEESVDAILAACEIKKDRPSVVIVVAGCLAQRYAQEIKDELPEVDYFIGTSRFADIADIIDKNNRIDASQVNAPLKETGRIPFDDFPYAYVKISEGCDKHCTYCIIPKIKGSHRSRKEEDILNEVKLLCQNNNKKEIILIAQDTGNYGTDLYAKHMLSSLIRKIAQINEVEVIRLLYVYPEEIDDELIQTFKECDKLAKYIDIPLQHVNDRILKLMNRRTSKSDIYAIINKLRTNIPDIAIRSTFITGFPSETDEDVKELDDFIKEVKLTRAGVFAYSREEDTPAYNMPCQIDEEEKLARRDMIMLSQQEISEEIMASFVGKTMRVIVEEFCEDNLWCARSYLDAPDIDGVVYVYSDKELEINTYYNVKITDSMQYDLEGTVIS